MLFRRDIEPNCAYCEYAQRADDNGGRADGNAQGGNDRRVDGNAQGDNDRRADGNAQGGNDRRADGNAQGGNGTELQCVKRGNMSAETACKSFRYDPLKRVPPRPAALRRKFREEDFSL